jgi:nucleoside-diphosphate-sugar epimerase
MEAEKGYVAVTGASGFIGRRIAWKLGQSGYFVRCLFRRNNPPKELHELAAHGHELLQIELTDQSKTDKAVSGCRGVVHAAGKVSDWGEPAEFKEANTNVTQRLLDSAEKAGVTNFISIGSVSVHGFGNHRNTTEKGPYYPLLTPYQQTKLEAEKRVLKRNREDFQTTVLRPGNVYGPGDHTTFYKIFDSIVQGLMPMIGSGQKLTCPVFVDDFADSVIMAKKTPECAGEVFNITGGERVTWRDLLSYSAKCLGVAPIRFPLPAPFVELAADVLEGGFKIFGIEKEPPLTRYRVSQVTHDFHFDISKAKSILGYKPKTDYRDGFRKTVNAYLREKMD